MGEIAIDEVKAQIEALAMSNDVRRIALRELIRELTPEQAQACSGRIRSGIARMLQERGSLKPHEDEATAVELATILASLGPSERSGFMLLEDDR